MSQVAFSVFSSAPSRPSFYYQARTQVLPLAVAASIGWLQPLSVPPARADAPQGQSVVPFNTVQQSPLGWFQPLSRAAPESPVWPGQSVVPFDTAQINTETIDKWQQPLSAAPQRADAPLGQVIFVVPPPKPPQGWFQALSEAPPRLPLALGSAVFISVSQDNTVTIDKWQQPLSSAADIPKVSRGFSVVPLDTVQINTETIDKWQQPLSKAVKRPPTFFSLTFLSGIAEEEQADNTVTIDKWQQPLSIAADIPRAPQGFSFVPFDTAQPETQTIDKWQQPLSVATQPVDPPRPQTIVIVPPPQPPRGWFQLPSVAPQRPDLPALGFSVVPFSTAQANTVTIDKWQQPLSSAADIPRAPKGFSVVPSGLPSNTVTIDKWQQPLSIAVDIPRYAIGATFVPFDTVQTSVTVTLTAETGAYVLTGISAILAHLDSQIGTRYRRRLIDDKLSKRRARQPTLVKRIFRD